MRLSRSFFATSLLCLLLCLPIPSWADPFGVFVSIAPQKYFVEQIGQGLVKVRVMVPPGASPATYEPKPSQMAALADAHVYFSIGVPFERVWLSKIAKTNPHMALVPTDRGIQKLAMAEHDHHGSHHDPHHHDEPGLDPHIWTSPDLVIIQAATISKALQKLDPSHAAHYKANQQRFAEQLTALDQELHRLFDPMRGLHFMVFHPSWGYFARSYGLVQIPIEIQGQAPKPAQLKNVIELAREKKIKVIFVQPQFSAKSARLIARAIDGQVIPADPLAPDWSANLRRQAQAFKHALR